MAKELRGSHEGSGLRFALVVAEFNSFITERLLEGAQRALKAAGVADDDVTIAYVPGSFELPLVAKRLAESGLYDAVLCLGCVIRGVVQTVLYLLTSLGWLLVILQSVLKVAFVRIIVGVREAIPGYLINLNLLVLLVLVVVVFSTPVIQSFRHVPPPLLIVQRRGMPRVFGYPR